METKWAWMMDYCRSRKLPAAQSWAWNKAEKAWNKRINSEGG